MSANARCRIVLFSGGSASNALAVRLESLEAEIVHVIAVFDNGGSTGELRRISPWPMPAIGDIRNRLTALAASATASQCAVKELFDVRFSAGKSAKQLREQLNSYTNPDHHALAELPFDVQTEILQALAFSVKVLPQDFSLHDLSLGNLLIFGRMLQTGDYLESITWAQRLLHIKSQVLPVTLDSVHLGALCEGGQWIRGQSALTDETYTLPGKVERICFLEHESTHAFAATAVLCPAVVHALETADAFVVGFGSFLTSILPHFAVRGVGAAFSTRRIPKFFLCNPTVDKETVQFTVGSMLETIASYARSDLPLANNDGPIITHVLHFGSDQKTRIPMGNISGFHGQYFDISGISDSTMMSNRASEVIAEALRLPAPKSSSHGHPGRARLVAFLDLDATLFDYSKVRIDATAAALRGMVSNPEGIGHDLFELLRYSLTDLLVNLGFHDLRRTWDSPEVLLFACMLDSEFSRAALVALSELSQESVSSEDDVSLAHRILSFQRARKIRREARAVFDSVAELRLRWNSQLADRSRVFREYVESSANLAPGARELITQLKDARAELHVVSEGDSAIQRFKFNSLGLAELFQTCVVTDVTCGVLSILDELFQLFKDTEIQQVPSFVIELYDVLAPYTIKSPAFFSKLLHSIVDTSPGTLQQRVQSPRFLTPQEWQ
ncbi:MAG TPA: 2-phospho-L-lactate transferase CofD family protein, partial [Candidatus Angelobacter sp.]|nr:2-phospho-L-lactate transferase CofD family protein [Candidatus Angelobacter sp.]